jgi:hypothetical protein
MAFSNVVKQTDQFEHPSELTRLARVCVQTSTDHFGVNLEVDFDMSENGAVHHIRIGRIRVHRLSTHYLSFVASGPRVALRIIRTSTPSAGVDLADVPGWPLSPRRHQG